MKSCDEFRAHLLPLAEEKRLDSWFLWTLFFKLGRTVFHPDFWRALFRGDSPASDVELEERSDVKREALLEHLEECEDCRNTVEVYRRIVGGARHIRLEEEALKDVRERVDTSLPYHLSKALSAFFLVLLTTSLAIYCNMAEWSTALPWAFVFLILYIGWSNRIADLELATRALTRRTEADQIGTDLDRLHDEQGQEPSEGAGRD